MEFILKLIVTPLVILMAAKYFNSIYIKNTKAAIITSLLILMVGFLIGWLLTFLFNILTLGTFWILGLGIVTRTIAYGFVIEIVDKFRNDFNTNGLWPSFLLSIILAISWAIVERIV